MRNTCGILPFFCKSCCLIILLVFTAIAANAAYTITKFSAGNFCSAYPSSYVTGSFALNETTISGVKGFTKGQTNATLILGFSNASFQFNPGAGTVTVTGTEVTIVSYTITATAITVTITTSSNNAQLNTINFNNIQVRATASGTGYITRTGGTFKVDNKNSNPSSTTSWGDLSALIPLSHSSNTATQTVTSTAFSGSTNNQVIGVQVVVAGTCSTTSATAFNFNTTGSTAATTDIANAKLYYTGTTGVFSTGTLFGSVTAPNGSFSITGSQVLSAAGTYYFWLTYDLNSLAVAANVIDAQLISSVVGGSTLTATAGNPAGSRTISANNFYSIGTGLWSSTALWSRTSGGASCTCAPTGGTGFVYVNHAVTLDNSYTVDNVFVQTGGNLTNAALRILTVTNTLATTGTGLFAASTAWAPVNISTEGTGISTTSAALSLTGALSVGSGSTFQATGGVGLSVGGNLTVNGTLSLGTSNLANSGAGSIVNGTGSITGSGIITLGSNKSIPSGTSLTIAPVVTISNSTSITSNGTINMQNDITGNNSTSKWINASGSVLNMGGTSSALLATGDLDASAITNTVNYSGSGNQSIKTPSTSYYNLYMSSTGTGSKSLGGGITVGNDVQITTGAQFNTASNSITVNGNWINNSTNTTPFVSTGTVSFNGANTISGTGVTSFNNLSITSLGLLTSNISTGKVIVSGNWVNDGYFAHNSSDITFNGTSTISGLNITTFNTVIVNATKTLTLSSVETDIDADLTVNGTLANNNGLLLFSGNGTNQNINGAATTLTANLLEIATASGDVVMARPLTVSSTATFTSGTLSIGNNTLTLNGGTAYTTGTITGSSSSNLVIGGNALAQALNFTQTSSVTRTLKDFTLGANATATIGTPLNITSGASFGTLIVNSSATLTTGGNLTLQSNAGGTARVGISAGTITGNVIVERYLPVNTANSRTGRAWRLLATPVTSAQTINTAWQQSQVSNNAANFLTSSTSTSATPVVGYGTRITGLSQLSFATASSHGYDFWNEIYNSSSSIRRYKPGTTVATRGWVNLEYDNNGTFNVNNNPKTTLISSEQGFLVYIRGDRYYYNQAANGQATIMSATGTLRQGNLTATIIPSGTSTFTLLGNPYASAVDFETIYTANSTKILARFTVWDANLNLNGGYRLVQRTAANTYTITPSGPSTAIIQYIQSGEAVFVEAATNTANTLSIQESNKTALGSDVLLLRQANNTIPGSLNINLNIRVNDSTVLIADGAVVSFSSVYKNAVTTEDAPKSYNFTENLAIGVDTFRLISEKRPLPAKTDTVFLKLWGTGVKNYQFEIYTAGLKLPAGIKALLIDKYLNTATPISLNGISTTVDFSIGTDSASKSIDRFYIVAPGAGAAVIKDGYAGEQVSGPAGETSIKASPNPVNGSSVKVSVLNLAKGSYQVEIYDNSNKRMLTRKIEHPGGPMAENITLAKWANGQYNIQLMDAKGNKVKSVSIVISR